MRLTLKGLAVAFLLMAMPGLPTLLWFFEIPVPGHQKPAPPIATIQGMSKLATTSIHITTPLEGGNRHYQGRWSLHGDALIGLDLTKASYVSADPEKRTAVLRLPQPHVIHHKVDHDHSFEIALNRTTLIPLSATRQDIRDAIWRAADEKIGRLAADPAYSVPARANAETALRNLFSGAGWQVTFQWEGDTAAASIGPLPAVASASSRTQPSNAQ